MIKYWGVRVYVPNGEHVYQAADDFSMDDDILYVHEGGKILAMFSRGSWRGVDYINRMVYERREPIDLSAIPE